MSDDDKKPDLLERAALALTLPETYGQLAVVVLLGAVLATDILAPFRFLQVVSGLPVFAWAVQAGIPLSVVTWIFLVLVFFGLILLGLSKIAGGLFLLFWVKPWALGRSLVFRYSANQWWSLSNRPVPPPDPATLATMVAVVVGVMALLALGRLRDDAGAQVAADADRQDVYRTSLGGTVTVVLVAALPAAAAIALGVVA